MRTGAKVNHSSVWGETALHLLFKRKGALKTISIRMSTSDLGAVKEEQQVEILRYLLKHGARPVVSDENQLTPLMLAGTMFLVHKALNSHSYDSFSWSANLCPVAFG